MKAFIVHADEWGELVYADTARRARWLMVKEFLPYGVLPWDFYTAFRAKRWPSMDKYAITKGIENDPKRQIEAGWHWTCRECHAVLVEYEDGLCEECRQ